MENLLTIEDRLKNIEDLLSQSKSVLNLDEVCSLTGLSKSHMYKLTCASKIPHYKQSKHLYFDRVEIENWLKENRFKSTNELNNEASTFVSLNPKRRNL
ncbi:MAG TPA: helix-turn-helix domain-containing protein [Saprospiraceae bacterium]|nr:helix-turn-helix domain-containing protein [Saprospiraceae bacterium]